MFYRVACLTNLFYPMPLTREFAMRFQEGSQVSTQLFSFAGILTLPSTTNEYVAMKGSYSSTIRESWVDRDPCGWAEASKDGDVL